VPGQITTAGRIAFIYRDDYLAGALFVALPSGRWAREFWNALWDAAMTAWGWR
jgi:hypothetical protein